VAGALVLDMVVVDPGFDEVVVFVVDAPVPGAKPFLGDLGETDGQIEGAMMPSDPAGDAPVLVKGTGIHGIWQDRREVGPRKGLRSQEDGPPPQLSLQVGLDARILTLVGSHAEDQFHPAVGLQLAGAGLCDEDRREDGQPEGEQGQKARR
jgi:hypothetical protein